MPRRMIDTAIWSDERVTDLSAHAQLVYLRLILGDETGPAGASRVALKRVAVDVNLDRQEVAGALGELVDADLVRVYEGGWMWLPSFIRYQLAGPNFIRGIRRQARECPDALRLVITRAIDAIVGPETEDERAKTARKGRKRPTESDGSPTGKSATSRENVDSSASVGEDVHDSSATVRGEVQDQDQDQDQDPPSEGGSWSSDTHNGNAAAAAPTPAPAPGAQAPAPPGRDTPGYRVSAAGDVPLCDWITTDEASESIVVSAVRAVRSRGAAA